MAIVILIRSNVVAPVLRGQTKRLLPFARCAKPRRPSGMHVSDVRPLANLQGRPESLQFPPRRRNEATNVYMQLVLAAQTVRTNSERRPSARGPALLNSVRAFHDADAQSRRPRRPLAADGRRTQLLRSSGDAH